MFAAVDVDYSPEGTTAACVTFADWTATSPLRTLSLRASVGPAPYQPGEFYKRELPYLLDVLARIEASDALRVVIVDGFVWLGPERPGLGAKLHEALAGRVAVVGVAKRGFHGAPALEVQRGASDKPVYVTAVGVDAHVAAAGVRSMHGEHRIPWLLKKADLIARGIERGAFEY